MPTSPELRRRFQPRDSDQKQAIEGGRLNRELTPSQRLIVDSIRERHKAGRSTTLGEGRSGKVVKIDFWDEKSAEQLTPWVVKSEHHRTREQDLLNIELDDEMELQETAFRIIEAAKKRNPEVPYASIPRPLALFYESVKSSDTPHNKPTRWLIMEAVEGETVFERTLKEFLRRFIDEPAEREAISKMQKEELIERILEDDVIHMLPPRFLDEINSGLPMREGREDIDERHCIGIALQTHKYLSGPTTILNMDQWNALKNTIDELHRKGLHHRDLHPSNIMLTNDGGVAIIDFGLSVHNEHEKNQRNVYAVETLDGQFGSRIVRLPVDNKSLDDLYKIAKKVA